MFYEGLQFDSFFNWPVSFLVHYLKVDLLGCDAEGAANQDPRSVLEANWKQSGKWILVFTFFYEFSLVGALTLIFGVELSMRTGIVFEIIKYCLCRFSVFDKTWWDEGELCVWMFNLGRIYENQN